MAFKNEDQLRYALEWFNITQNPSLPKAELVGDTWRDDHALCMTVKFGDVFEYSFWYMVDEFLWHVARCHEDRDSALLVWNGIADAFGADGESIYQYENSNEEIELPDSIVQNIAQLRAKLKTMG